MKFYSEQLLRLEYIKIYNMVGYFICVRIYVMIE